MYYIVHQIHICDAYNKYTLYRLSISEVGNVVIAPTRHAAGPCWVGHAGCTLTQSRCGLARHYLEISMAYPWLWNIASSQVDPWAAIAGVEELRLLFKCVTHPCCQKRVLPKVILSPPPLPLRLVPVLQVFPHPLSQLILISLCWSELPGYWGLIWQRLSGFAEVMHLGLWPGTGGMLPPHTCMCTHVHTYTQFGSVTFLHKASLWTVSPWG